MGSMRNTVFSTGSHIKYWGGYVKKVRPKTQEDLLVEAKYVREKRKLINKLWPTYPNQIGEDHIPTFNDPDPQWGDLETWVRVLEGDYAFTGMD